MFDTLFSLELHNGNMESFEALYRAYHGRIYNFVLSLVGDVMTAKDITHDIFIHIWEKRENIKIDNNLNGYLFKISQNMVYRYIRRELLLRNYLDNCKAEAIEEPDIDTDIDTSFLETQILKLIEDLPAARKTIFMLYWKADMNYREIAKRLNISEKTVATQVHRSLDFLKNRLGPITFSVFCALCF
jgi:RNA polymerase sigma-70 factor (ECF subfamily)